MRFRCLINHAEHFFTNAFPSPNGITVMPDVKLIRNVLKMKWIHTGSDGKPAISKNDLVYRQ